MTDYSMFHWGIYEVEQTANGAPVLHPFKMDPDPSRIGQNQTDPEVMKMRVRRPAIRKSWYEKGPGANPEKRGHEPFIEVEWDEALELVAKDLSRVKSSFGNEAIFGGSYGWASAGRFHHAQSQIHRFLNVFGGYVRHADSYSLGAARVLMPHIVATMDELMKDHTSWDVMADSTELFVCFGGVPEKNAQVAPGGVGQHQVQQGLLSMAKGGTRFVNVSPVRDNLNPGTDSEWIPIRPNTDTAMMLGIAWTLVDEHLDDKEFLETYCVGFDKFLSYLTGEADGVAKTPEWAEKIIGVPATKISALAREMAQKRTMLNISWALQRADHGEQPFWMLVTLAAMLGQIGQPGGGFGVGYGPENSMGNRFPRLRAAAFPQGENPVDAFIPVARITDMLLSPGQPFVYNGGHHVYPDIRLVYWAGGNPFHHHQDLHKFIKAWQKPETIIVHEQCWNSLSKYADIVLPATTSLERHDIGYASREGYLVAMKKYMDPVGSSRDDFDILSELSAKLGCEEAFTQGLNEMDWVKRLYNETRQEWVKHDIEIPPFDEFWNDGIVSLAEHQQSVIMLEDFKADPHRFPLKTPSGKIEINSSTIAGFNLPDCPGHPVWFEPAEWLGGSMASQSSLHMLSDQPSRKLHSQLDPGAFSMEGKRQGREIISMHPQDAMVRNINQDDIVEVFNQRGVCLASADITKNVMCGVVRLSTGAWFDLDIESGLETHGNPNVLTLDLPASGLSQGCAAQTCLVDIRPARKELPPVKAFTLPAFTIAQRRQNEETELDTA